MRSERGISLTELMIYIGLSSFMVMLVGQAFHKSFHLGDKLVADGQTVEQIEQIGMLVNNIGRLASSCTKSASSLTCSVDFNSPPTGAPTDVRFLLQSNQLIYQKRQGANWVTEASVSGVSDFEICDESSMAGSPPSCSLQPQKMSTAYLNLVGLPSPMRFFRFRITSQGNASAPSRSYQSSFYVRNPAPFGVSYNWGP